MEINIDKKRFDVGADYIISVGKQETYSAVQNLMIATPLAKFELIKNDQKVLLYNIDKTWSMFKIKFDIKKWDGNVFLFRTRSFWKRHYYCQVGKDLYEIFAHNGYKFSIYRNNTQIAWSDSYKVPRFNDLNNKLICDKDCDYELIISFCLIMYYSFSRNSSAKQVNIGGSPQAKEFDPLWQPK